MRDHGKVRERRAGLLTEKQAKYVFFFAGDADKAAQLAGYSPGAAVRLMKNPTVRAAIEKKQSEMIKQAAEKQVKDAVLTRDFILERCAAIAAERADARRGYQDHLAAMKLGAEVLGLIGKNDGAKAPGDAAISVYRSAWLSEQRPAEA